jgi:hypothetical protein
MQGDSPKVSKIKIRSDWPVGASSTTHGANLNAIGFNLQFIMERDPKLAADLLKLYRRASVLRQNDPLAPEEDYHLAAAELARLTDIFIS